MQVKLSQDKRSLVVAFPYSATLVALVKRLPGRSYVPSSHNWTLPLNDQAAASVTTLEQNGFTVDPEVSTAIAQLGDKLRQLNQLSANNTSTVSSLVSALPLYDFQKQGVVHNLTALQALGGSLNACDVGLGKTLQALAVVEAMPDIKQVLVLAPKSVLYQWQAECTRWLPKASVVVVDGPKQARMAQYATVGQLPRPLIVIMGYETLRNDIDGISWHWDLTIADEAHRLGSTTTELYKAVHKLKALRRLALTATPLMNRVLDLWGIYNWLVPGYLGPYHAFVEHYCLRNPWGGVEGYRELDKLAERLAPLMFRRTLDQVALQLPELTYETIPVELSKTERDLYTKVKKELLFELQPQLVNKLSSPMVLQNTLVKLGKLQELTDSLELLGTSTESSKLAALKDHIADVLVSGHKVIVFTKFERMARLIHQALQEYGVVLFTGQVEAEGRQEVVSSFSLDERTKVLVATDAGGVGLNLQAASIVYNYDLPFSVGRYKQRTGRAHRIGQLKPVIVYNLIASKTIDQHVWKILQGKHALSDQLLGDDNAIGWSEVESVLTGE